MKGTMNMPAGIHVVRHPLVRAKVTVLRDKTTGTELFRRTLGELAILVAYEATRDLEVEELVVQTPLEECAGSRLKRPVTIVPILRAGLGMAEALLKILPAARVGHVGMARNETTFLPESYYFKAPPDIASSDVLLVDPMLATGNSAADAADELKKQGVTRLRLVAILGCEQGAALFKTRHPGVDVFLAAMDHKLNEKAYIVPGLGDAGDRYFGT
jgi:uracil phosphoribosyltransferase